MFEDAKEEVVRPSEEVLMEVGVPAAPVAFPRSEFPAIELRPTVRLPPRTEPDPERLIPEPFITDEVATVFRVPLLPKRTPERVPRTGVVAKVWSDDHLLVSPRSVEEAEDPEPIPDIHTPLTA